MGIVDIHNHSLFGIDDGARTIEDSILMLKDAIANNITDLILTPHQNKRIDSTNVLKNFEILKEKARDLNINLYLGAEVRYYDLDKVTYTTLNNSKYCLIEFTTRLPVDIEEVCYSMKTMGLKPIVAHAERYHYLKKEDYHLIKEQACIQVNAETIIGRASLRKDIKIVKYLLKHRLVDFVASDAHNVTDRKNEMLKAYLRVKKRYGSEYSDLIFKENAKNIIK